MTEFRVYFLNIRTQTKQTHTHVAIEIPLRYTNISLTGPFAASPSAGQGERGRRNLVWAGDVISLGCRRCALPAL